MKRYTVSQARERLADVLDEAERTGSVAIERRDVRYVIRPERPSQARRARASVIEVVDAAVDRGQWQWNWTARGVRFARRRRP
jgi:hypothetical protein